MASTTETSRGITTQATQPHIPPTPIFATSKVIIRPYQPSDAPAIAHEANNPLISQYMRNLFPSPYTLAAAENWIQIATTGLPLRNWAICRASDGQVVGGIGLKTFTDVECRTMEVGYWVGQDHWGQGLTTDAVIGLTRWAFEEITELLRLEANVFESNAASERVLVKAGFTYEGTRRKAIFKHGKVLDLKYYGLLREECPGLKK